MPKISIIIPCYNQAHFLKDSVESVKNQTFTDWECIIVNDGSTDNTDEISKLLCKSDKRLKYLEKENGGLSSARNYGINYSNSEYILPLDADDIIEKDYINDAIKILEQNKEKKLIIYGRAKYFGEKTGEWFLENFSIDKMIFSNLVYASAIYNKSDFLEIGGYDESFKYGWEDWDFWLSMYELGNEFIKMDKIYFNYRVTKGSMIRSMDDYHKNYSLKLIYLKHHKLYDKLFSNPISLFYEKEYYEKKFYEFKKSFWGKLFFVLKNGKK